MKIAEGAYDNTDAVENVIRYIMRLHNPSLVDGCGVFPLKENDIIRQFNYIKDYYGKDYGKRVFHIIISVDSSLRLNEAYMMNLARLIGGYFGNERQVLYAVHNDVSSLHIHMCVNTVAFTNGEYRDFFDIKEIKRYAERCCSMVAEERWFNNKMVSGI